MVNRSVRWLASSLVSSLALVACMNSASGPGSVEGSVGGKTFDVTDAISASVPFQLDNGQTAFEAVIVMANSKTLCADATANVLRQSEDIVVIRVTDVNGSTFTTPTVPDTYSIYQTGTPPAHAGLFSTRAIDATCTDIKASTTDAANGTVTLSSISGNRFSGTFDVALVTGDHITGTFDPEECPGLKSAMGQVTCQP
jgi:hypothetical protein